MGDITIGLTGLAYNLNNISNSGFIVTTGNNGVTTRIITASGANIWIGSGNGVSGNPIIGLNPYTSGLNTLQASYLYSNSGYFNNLLQVNGTGVSLTGHTHTVSNITNFNSSVSGLLSVTSISAGSGIAVSSSSGNHTVSVNIIDCGIIGAGYTPPAIGQTLPFSVVLSSGVSYSIPANCSSMKIWVIGGGGNGGKGAGAYYICAGGGGGGGGCAYKTWSNPVGSVSMSIGGPTQATSLSYSSQTITGNAGSNGQDGYDNDYVETSYAGAGGNGGTYSGGDGGANGSRGYGRSEWNCTSNGNGGGGIGGSYTGSTTQSTTGQSASDISGLLAALTAAGASVPFNTTVSAGTNASTFGGGGAGNTTTNAGNGYFGGGGGGTGGAAASGGVGGSGVVVISFS